MGFFKKTKTLKKENARRKKNILKKRAVTTSRTKIIHKKEIPAEEKHCKNQDNEMLIPPGPSGKKEKKTKLLTTSAKQNHANPNEISLAILCFPFS